MITIEAADICEPFREQNPIDNVTHSEINEVVRIPN